MDFSAVIFDLDGTLLYTLEEIATAGNDALARLGYPTHPVDAYNHFLGSGAKKLALRMLPPDQQTQEVFNRFNPILEEELNRSLNTVATPYPGIAEALHKLEESGKKYAVLSNKPEKFTKVAIRKFLPSANFFEVRGGRDDMPLKPAPDSALALARNMGVEPERTLFVGDTDVDMLTASNAGMISVGAAWGYRGADELAKAGAQVVVDASEDLVKLL